MKAAILHAPQQPLTIEDVEIADAGPQEVLVRTAVTGLCHSDRHFIDGAFPHPRPLVLGHEASGVQGRLHLDHLISNSLPLAEINDGFARMRGGAPVRQIIDFRV